MYEYKLIYVGTSAKNRDKFPQPTVEIFVLLTVSMRTTSVENIFSQRDTIRLRLVHV